MAFTPKVWLNGRDGGTPINGLSLQDLERRVTDYADTQPGPDGESAYQVWLDAGNRGTEADFLTSLIGARGDTGPAGSTGARGDAGPGVAAGGAQNQILAKNSVTDYDTVWIDVPGLAAGSVGTTQLADSSVTSARIADGTIVQADIADNQIGYARIISSLKPSGGAGNTSEALRALGTTSGTAAAGNDARFTKTIRESHTWVFKGTLATQTLYGWFESLGSSETARLVKVRAQCGSGTFGYKLQKNGSDITGFSQTTQDSTPDSLTPTAVTLAEDDRIDLVITAVSSASDMIVTAVVERTVS